VPESPLILAYRRTTGQARRSSCALKTPANHAFANAKGGSHLLICGPGGRRFESGHPPKHPQIGTFAKSDSEDFGSGSGPRLEIGARRTTCKSGLSQLSRVAWFKTGHPSQCPKSAIPEASRDSKSPHMRCFHESRRRPGSARNLGTPDSSWRLREPDLHWHKGASRDTTEDRSRGVKGRRAGWSSGVKSRVMG
jgi:hypothetical protein